MKLIDKLPSFYSESSLVNDLQDSFSKDRDILEEEIKDFINQIFVDTATWSLDSWEEFVGIPTNKSLTYDLRRSRVKSKITRFIPALSKNQLTHLIRHYFDEVSIKDIPRENRFEVLFANKDMAGDNFSYAIRDIEEIKPAHLDFSVFLGYIYNVEIEEIFTKCKSDLLMICGTVVASEKWNDGFISTIGKSFKSDFESSYKANESELFRYPATDELLFGSDGKTFKTLLEKRVERYKSDEFKEAASYNYASEKRGKLND